MAVRTPLKNDSGNVKEKSSAEVDQIVDQIVYQYSLILVLHCQLLV